MEGIQFNPGKGFMFSKHIPKEVSPFDRVFGIFKELLTHTSGDIEEAFDWLNQLDDEYGIFSDEYTLADFEEDLKKRGYIREEIDPDDGNDGKGKGRNILTPKLESALREYALEQIFGKLRKSGLGNHRTKKAGQGDDREGDLRAFRYGDDLSLVNMTESLKNARINHGMGDLRLTENDLVVEETLHKAQMSTVLMIDISHSMILYGEDRITPAKKVAMALVEMIHRRVP
jgi:Ca-activated chloride channel homolog